MNYLWTPNEATHDPRHASKLRDRQLARVRERLNRRLSLMERDKSRDLYAGATHPLSWIASALLAMCVVSITTMPLTQYLWSWDRFMHGGQDFELGALMVLTLLCLALVLPKHCQQCVHSRFIRISHASPDLIHGSAREILSSGMALISRTTTAPASSVHNLPLQI